MKFKKVRCFLCKGLVTQSLPTPIKMKKVSIAYKQLISQNKLNRNQRQRQFVAILDRLYCQVSGSKRWFNIFKQQQPRINGIYLWGSVGSGKTFLIDLLLKLLPPKLILRTHFHQFMADFHNQLQQNQGTKNPIPTIVSKLYSRYKIIFIDEFFVSDIADAMVLANLIATIVNKQIVLIVTSNIKADDLYKDGLQRQRFIPTIKFINSHFTNIELSTEQDFRMLKLSTIPSFYAGDDAEAKLLEIYKNLTQNLTPNSTIKADTVKIVGRNIPIKAQFHNIVWFDFADLCAGPRSQRDYLEITNKYQIVLVSNIPKLDTEDITRRFVYLVDAAYDQKIRLIAASKLELDTLYNGNLTKEFARTKSRLMQGSFDR